MAASPSPSQALARLARLSRSLLSRQKLSSGGSAAGRVAGAKCGANLVGKGDCHQESFTRRPGSRLWLHEEPALKPPQTLNEQLDAVSGGEAELFDVPWGTADADSAVVLDASGLSKARHPELEPAGPKRQKLGQLHGNLIGQRGRRLAFGDSTRCGIDAFQVPGPSAGGGELPVTPDRDLGNRDADQ
jgi:hypothetical protein